MHEFFGKMVFMMVIWGILTLGYNWLHEGRFDWMGVLIILPVISIMWFVWDLVDGFFGWSAPQFPVLKAAFGQSHHPWWGTLSFWIVVIARVFLFGVCFECNGWFRWMVILSVPWSKLDYEFDWKTPWWLFAIVTGIITIEWNRLKEERRERLCRDWVAEGKEIEEEIKEIEELGKKLGITEEENEEKRRRKIRRGGKAKSAPKRARKKAKKRIEK